MRTRDVLVTEFENIKVFCQYLYMSEEHSVIIHNVIGTPLKIRMDEDLMFRCHNLNYPDVPEINWSERLTLPELINVIAVLKEEPAIEFPDRFKNRWEEISTICKMNIAQNVVDTRRIYNEERR